MLRLTLIRHSLTRGNLKKRYVGVTDEPLCQEGIDLLQRGIYPEVEAVFISPMSRCIQTAEILYPHCRRYEIAELSECDFGEFENKNYQELSDNPRYQAWIDSGGTLPFPNGESREQFSKRSICGFRKVIKDCVYWQLKSAALVVHGGTIMNIMETFAKAERSFYQWHVKNGCGYLVEIDIDGWMYGREKLYVLGNIPYQEENQR